jgi:hypothetical protein
MRRSRCCMLGFAALAALVFSGVASAACGHHTRKGNPTVSQYVESLHTSCGSNAPGSSGGGGGSVKLSANVAHDLHGSSGAGLRSIATHVALGARPKNLRGDVGATGAGNPLSASIGALGSGSGARLLILLGLMAGVAAVMLGAGIRRRRSSR